MTYNPPAVCALCHSKAVGVYCANCDEAYYNADQSAAVSELFKEPWQNDLLQFARLLCELDQCCGDQIPWDDLCEGMDLTTEQLWELQERARVIWDRAVAHTTAQGLMIRTMRTGMPPKWRNYTSEEE